MPFGSWPPKPPATAPERASGDGGTEEPPSAAAAAADADEGGLSDRARLRSRRTPAANKSSSVALRFLLLPLELCFVLVVEDVELDVVGVLLLLLLLAATRLAAVVVVVVISDEPREA